MPVRCRRKGVEGFKKLIVFKTGPGPRHLLVVVRSLPVEMLSNTRDLWTRGPEAGCQWSPMQVAAACQSSQHYYYLDTRWLVTKSIAPIEQPLRPSRLRILVVERNADCSKHAKTQWTRYNDSHQATVSMRISHQFKSPNVFPNATHVARRF